MPYQPRIGVVRNRQVVFRAADFEVERLKRAQQGFASRGEYLRHLVDKDVKERGLE